MNGTSFMENPSLIYGTPSINGKPQCDRAFRRRQKWQAHQAKLEQEIAAFFRAAGVKNVDLSEMFEDFEWL